MSNEQDKEMMNNYKYAMKVSREFIKNNIKDDMPDIEKEAIISKYIVDWLDYDYEVLDDVSFHLDKGKTLALVGPSGGGKTTICHLIPRFYFLEKGHIYKMIELTYENQHPF